mgnify:CR=1 FL=1
MFSFQNPAGFLLLLLLPLFYILRKTKILKQTVIYAVLADWEGKEFVWNGKIRKFFSVLTKIMLAIAFILTVAAFADPVVSIQEKVYTSIGNDVIFVVDTSPSMAAKDINGERRIDSAKNAINTLVKNYDGYRYGIVALGSNASVSVPPTADSSVFEKKLAELQVGQFGNGSAIGDGLSTAVCHLASSKAPKKCIILMTDGENNAGEIHPETAAKLAASNQITVYVLGIGSKGRVPIEYTDLQTGKLYSGYLESDFNATSLKKIAEIGNGRYFEARTLEELERTLSSVAKTEVVSQSFSYKTITTSYYQQVLFFALILFVVAAFFKRFLLQEIVPFRFKKILILRSFFQLLALLMVFIAQTGISWGTYLTPIQKNNTAVSFVFDISNSMLAKDVSLGYAGKNLQYSTRLSAASIYAKKLLEHMNGTSVSVVLAKGDGINAIPLTEDYAMIESLLEVMSPSLMTVPGSSLGKGILCAMESFPPNFSAAGRIWLFTDGEETDGALSNAILECMRFGIPVSIIGFGEMDETEVLAGDGKTKVRTAFRKENIQKILDSVEEKVSSYKNQTPVLFIEASEIGSAGRLLSQLSTQQENSQIVSYEARPVPRYKLFLILAFIFFGASFFSSEFDFSSLRPKASAKLSSVILVFGLIFTLSLCGCQSSTKNSGKNKSSTGEAIKILRGTYEWHKKNYRKSIAFYLDAAQNSNNRNQDEESKQTLNYALYDLAQAYSMTGEDKAALERYSQISPDAPQLVRYKAYYNAGIIACNNGSFDEATSYFRKALEIDSSRIEAKINMELSIQMSETEAKQGETQAIPASQEAQHNQDLENTVFNHIKENDKKQWKNSESNQTQNLSDDY